MLCCDDLVKLAVSVLLGGLIGLEREVRLKSAGLRTMIFISLGATVFTMVSIKIGGDKDPARIAASIVTGVGFLGAGVILRQEGRVRGLTTAAAIWITAALGMAVGAGYHVLAASATLVSLLVLTGFIFLEKLLKRKLDET